MKFFLLRCRHLLLLLGLVAAAGRAFGQATAPSLINYDVEKARLVDNPWSGANSATGALVLPLGHQLSVDSNGRLPRNTFSPSVAVGDLNGDGLLDLVAADSYGYLWYFPNVGSKPSPPLGAARSCRSGLARPPCWRRQAARATSCPASSSSTSTMTGCSIWWSGPTMAGFASSPIRARPPGPIFDSRRRPRQWKWRPTPADCSGATTSRPVFIHGARRACSI